MARVKKFAEGKSVTDKFLDYVTDKDTRSVMDIPKKDMRDSKYRKELEKKQALETSSPELQLVGPIKAASATKELLKAPKELIKRAIAYSSGLGRNKIEDSIIKNEIKGLYEAPQIIREDSKLKKGGAVKSASARADGIAIRGKTRA